MDLQQMYERVVAGDASVVGELVQQGVAERVPPLEIISEYLIPAMTEVGTRFERGQFFVPEMVVAAGAMQAGLTVLKPLRVEEESDTAGQVVVGTVKGDVHDIGKNLVSMMLEGAGYRGYRSRGRCRPREVCEGCARAEHRYRGHAGPIDYYDASYGEYNRGLG